LEHGVEVDWVESDMRSFRRRGAFDLAVNLYTSFGYFDRMDDDQRVLENLRESLRDGGRLVMQMAGKEQLATAFQPSSADEIPGAGLLVQRREVTDDWCRVHNRWTVIRDGRAEDLEFRHTVYSARELRDLLVAAGFVDVRFFGDLDGNPYGPEAERLVAVATA
jgi:SAM-dependent methyltransferase